MVATLPSVGGCLAAPTPQQRLTDAARELNLAARFGRMDVAVGHTNSSARQSFLERRSEWGKGVRVVDINLSGLQFEDEESAQITVDVAWMRMNESVLRNTRLAQTWRNEDSGWQLARERREAGDVGLFGEAVPAVRTRPHGDVHFATKVIK